MEKDMILNPYNPVVLNNGGKLAIVDTGIGEAGRRPAMVHPCARLCAPLERGYWRRALAIAATKPHRGVQREELLVVLANGRLMCML